MLNERTGNFSPIENKNFPVYPYLIFLNVYLFFYLLLSNEKSCHQKIKGQNQKGVENLQIFGLVRRT
jgi:hypothetical protein